MKKLTLTSIIAMAIAISAFSQSPQAFKYQAVVRDNAGEIIANQTVSFRISIRLGSALGFIVYQETHSVTTNDFGLASLEIGNGVTTDDFSAIDWTSGPKYLETELDPANGSSYVSLGTTQLLSVPFALYAESAGSDNDWTEDGNQLYNNNSGNVGIGTTSPAAKLEVAGRISQTGTGYSVFLGEHAGANDDLVNNYNTFIGRFSGYENTSGALNTFLGQGSGVNNTTGSNNTFLGYQSGLENLLGTDNVFLGYKSGYFETGSNKLYIENSDADSENALIYGEFDNDILAINGNVGIGTTTPQADLDVIGTHGISVTSTFRGVSVANAGTDGVYVARAGNPSNTLSSAASNGFEVAGAQGDGLYVGDAGGSGVYVGYTGGSGVFVGSAGGSGVSVNSAVGYGVYVYTASGDGVFANTSDANHEYGIYTNDKMYATLGYYPAKSGTFGKFSGSGTLEPGDLVAISGGYEENVLGEGGVPVVNVEKANAGNSGAVFGVVEYKVSFREDVEKLEDGKADTHKSFRHADGNVMPGNYLAIIVFGPVDVKVNRNSDIKKGEKLTVAENGTARSILDEDNWRIGILGKALENSNGKGTIKAYINCR